MSTYVPSEAEVEAAARAAAIYGDYDGCFERIDAWESRPEEERNDDSVRWAADIGDGDYEDANDWRGRARAALIAAHAVTPREDVGEAWERTIAQHKERLAATNGMWDRQRLAGKIEGLKLGRSLTTTTPSTEDRNRA